MICPRCRASMADNVSFCTNCGTQFGTGGQRPQDSSGAPEQARPGYPQQGQPTYNQPGHPQQGQPTYNQPGHPQQGQPTYSQPGHPQQRQATYSQPGYNQPGYAPQGQSGYSQPAPPGYGPQGQQPGYNQPGQQPGYNRPGYRPPAGPPHHGPPFAFDLKRLSAVDQVIGVSSLILIITLFLPWFGISIGGYSASESGFSAHGYLIIPLLTAIVLIAYLVMRAGWDHLPWKLPMEHAPLLLVGTGIQALIVLLAFLFKPAGTDWQFGAYLGLLAALVACGAIVAPAIGAMQGGTSAR